jgi:hypothetical protein
MYYFVGKIHITCEEREKAPGEAGGRRDGDENERGVILRSSSCYVHVGECEIDTIDSWSL